MSRFITREGEVQIIRRGSTALLAKHAKGMHDQKTHGGGMGPKWSKGNWAQMNNEQYVAFMSESWRSATSKHENRTISQAEWQKNYPKSQENFEAEKPTRTYKKGQVVLSVYENETDSKYVSEIYEGSLMRDIDDLQELYPRDAVIVKISDSKLLEATDGDKNAMGASGRGGAHMYLQGGSLNPNVMNLPSSVPVGSKAGLRTYVLTHEWGHLMDKRGEGQSYEDKVQEIGNIFSTKYDGVSGLDLMSKYGNSSPTEGFAEAFAEYVISKQRGFEMNNPVVLALANKYGWDKPWKK